MLQTKRNHITQTDNACLCHFFLSQATSAVAVVLAVVWEDIIIQTDLSFANPGVLVVTGCLACTLLLDLCVTCAYGGLDDSFDDGSAHVGTTTFCSSYLSSSCGAADLLSTVSVLLSFVKIIALASAPHEGDECELAKYFVLYPTSRFAFGPDGADWGGADGTSAGMAVQLLLSITASMKILKVLVKLRLPIVRALASCQRMLALANEQANVVPQRANIASSGQKRTPTMKKNGETERKLSNKMNMFLASTTYVCM